MARYLTNDARQAVFGDSERKTLGYIGADAYKRKRRLSGLASLVHVAAPIEKVKIDQTRGEQAAARPAFEDPSSADYSTKKLVCTAEMAREQRLAERARQNKKMHERESNRQSRANGKLTAEPYRTLFVGRLSYETDEASLRAFAERIGPVLCAIVVRNTNSGRSMGYGFVEFAEPSHLRDAFHRLDSNELDGRHVVVDVERGRTASDWRPRRLGGGLGTRRAGSPSESYTGHGRQPAAPSRGDNHYRGGRFQPRAPPRGNSNYRGQQQYSSGRGRGGYYPQQQHQQHRYHQMPPPPPPQQQHYAPPPQYQQAQVYQQQQQQYRQQQYWQGRGQGGGAGAHMQRFAQQHERQHTQRFDQHQSARFER
jgi:RNA recognition motif-containing protein